MRAHLLLLAGLLLAPSAALATPPPGAPAEPAPGPPVTVTLEVVKPLALVEWVAPGEKHGEVSLDGTLRARIVNRGLVPVTYADLETHGLVFTDEAGALHVVVHPCKCAKDAVSPAEAVRVLPPGAEAVVTLDEWGCKSTWKAPPPGRYTVDYRVLRVNPAALPASPDERPPHEVVDGCRARFTSPATWHGAFRSAPVPVVLKRPRKQRIE